MPTATIHRIRPPKGKLAFYEDNIIDGQVPIEMMQSNAIKQALAALDHLPESDEFAYMDSNLPIRLDPTDLRISIAPDFYRAGGELYGQALMGFKLVEGEYEPIDISPNERGLPSGYSDELGLRICALEWSKREELLRAQPNLRLVITANYQPWQLMFQDPDTGLYLVNMRTMIAEYRQAESDRRRAEAQREAERTRAAQAEADRRRAEQSLADERAAHQQTRSELQQRDARIRQLEERLRHLDS